MSTRAQASEHEACMRTLLVCKSVGRGRVGGKELKKRLQMVKRNHGVYF